MSAPPIACLLTGQDFKARLAWIADLNRRSLKEIRRHELQLTLTYDTQALADVEEMVAREQACCPFLSFAIRPDVSGVHLSITAPEEAREIADSVFDPFTGATQTAGCSCCGAAA